MAFATTCPQCKTSFKVVPDQLERGRGLVRCGVCKHVFAGADHLRYIDDLDSARQPGGDAEESARPPSTLGRPDESPIAAPAAAAPGIAASGNTAPATAAPGSAGPGAAGPGAAVPRAAAPAPAAPAVAPDPRFAAGAPLFPPPAEGEWDPLKVIGEPEPARDSDMLVASRDDGYSAGPAAFPGFAGAAGSAMSAGDQPRRSARPSDRHSYPDPAHDPIGVRPPSPARGEPHAGMQPDPHAIFTQAPSNWRANLQPGARDHEGTDSSKSGRRYAVTAIIVLLLLAALQLALLFRSEIANAVPALRPAADLLSGAFGLKVEAPRNLALLSIESTELQRVGGSGQASLHALLRNKDSRTVRWPAMELTLTDQAGAVVLRKVILPAEYLPDSAPREGLRALSEVPIRMGLDPGGLAIANYSVTLFYP